MNQLAARIGAIFYLIWGIVHINAAYGLLKLGQSLSAVYPGLLAMLLVLGFCSGLTVTPQQHRLFTLLPEVATIALGLNGSAIYLGVALGALFGGIVVAAGGASWLPVAATVLAAAGFGALRSISPERSAPGITREPTGQEMSQ